MAGNPLQKLLPYMKKYAVELYVSLGFVLYLKNEYSIKSTYKHLYSENDFQRRYTLDKMDQFMQSQAKPQH